MQLASLQTMDVNQYREQNENFDFIPIQLADQRERPRENEEYRPRDLER